MASAEDVDGDQRRRNHTLPSTAVKIPISNIVLATRTSHEWTLGRDEVTLVASQSIVFQWFALIEWRHKNCYACHIGLCSSQEILMKKIESVRDALSSWPSPEYIKNHEDAGWRLAAVEWQREIDVQPVPEPAAARPSMEEIPFGTRIAADCLHLQENPVEMQILNHLAEMVVQDLSYTRMAELLNQRAFRTRDGKPWTALAVFKLTPRLIEVAPRILSGGEWDARKKQLTRVAWNS
jgi:hypothetical protein